MIQPAYKQPQKRRRRPGALRLLCHPGKRMETSEYFCFYFTQEKIRIINNIKNHDKFKWLEFAATSSEMLNKFKKAPQIFSVQFRLGSTKYRVHKFRLNMEEASRSKQSIQHQANHSTISGHLTVPWSCVSCWFLLPPRTKHATAVVSWGHLTPQCKSDPLHTSTPTPTLRSVSSLGLTVPPA